MLVEVLKLNLSMLWQTLRGIQNINTIKLSTSYFLQKPNSRENRHCTREGKYF